LVDLAGFPWDWLAQLNFVLVNLSFALPCSQGRQFGKRCQVIKVAIFKSRCEGVQNEIVNIGGNILAGRATVEAEVRCRVVSRGGLHSQGIIWLVGLGNGVKRLPELESYSVDLNGRYWIKICAITSPWIGSSSVAF
jgi:hypothetical protein